MLKNWPFGSEPASAASISVLFFILVLFGAIVSGIYVAYKNKKKKTKTSHGGENNTLD